MGTKLDSSLSSVLDSKENLKPSDLESSKKLNNLLSICGFKNLFEFLILAPSGYDNQTPLNDLNDSSSGVLEVVVEDLVYRKTTLNVSAYATKFDRMISLIIFHPKPFHRVLFKPKKTITIQGVISNKFNEVSMLQPKVLNNATFTIKPIFKKKGVKSENLDSINSFISLNLLLSLNLKEGIAKALEVIFHPDLEFFKLYKKYSFSGIYLDALKYTEAFYHFMKFANKKTRFKANFVCGLDSNSLDLFVSTLPFSLTNAQLRVIKEIQNDFKSGIAAKRLIMGDVGCGKTMIILMSVVLAYPKKSLLMAPTTILANQLYIEAQKYLPKNIKVTLINAESKTESMLDSINADFLIGTQALLYRDLDLTDYALVMTDEQHRFGTNQRHILEKMAESNNNNEVKKPHILQFSATPIPRTMAMLESKLIDVSIIDELPFKKDISTFIISRTEFNDLLSHIKNEINKSNQVVIIYPLVNESEKINYMSISEGAPYWLKNFSGVFVTSGGDKDKDKVLEEFAKSGNILIATTLIEVGISLPRLSTIIIIAPERLGLATLHQLRGRVSRNGLKGYCFLYTNNKDNERLIEFSKNLNGFSIAELDLKYRKGGDILSGKTQSGAEWKWIDLNQDSNILYEAEKDFESILKKD